MGIVNQRVCDLKKCSQPITPEVAVTFVMPEDENGEPDVERKAEFHTPKCARTWVRAREASATDSRLKEEIGKLPANAGNKDKIAALTKRLSGKDAVDYPVAVAA